MSAFTPEEKSTIRYLANAPHTATDRIAAHASYLLPGIVISGYGIHMDDALAVATGATAILLYQLVQIYREARYANLYKSIFIKIEAINQGIDSKTA